MLNKHESAGAFSLAAARYDRDAAANLMMAWLRRESLRPLVGAFGAGSRALEVGCGTGVEAIALARRGVQVVATDASSRMVEVVREKAERLPPGGASIEAITLPAEELKRLLPLYGRGGFNGAYSSLGPLNCVADLRPVAAALAALVEPGGPLIISLLNKYCLWETAWYLAARQPRLAFRRWGGYARGTALPGGPRMDVYYWPIAEIERAFRPYFRVEQRRALPWVLPPTYAASFMARHPRLFSQLRRVEQRTSSKWPCYLLGDHVHFSMVRRNA